MHGLIFNDVKFNNLPLYHLYIYIQTLVPPPAMNSRTFQARNLKHPAAEKVKMAFEKTYNMSRGFRKKKKNINKNTQNGPKILVLTRVYL